LQLAVSRAVNLLGTCTLVVLFFKPDVVLG